ncbi:MAG: hypothetical protein AB7I19_16025 [Planctomycetota bacterium]
MASELPTADDINRFDSLDERSAVTHFLDKDLAAAESMLRDNFLHYQEDLIWMGRRAFEFYVRAAIRIGEEAIANGDEDTVNDVRWLLDQRESIDPGSIDAIAAHLPPELSRRS